MIPRIICQTMSNYLSIFPTISYTYSFHRQQVNLSPKLDKDDPLHCSVQWAPRLTDLNAQNCTFLYYHAKFRAFNLKINEIYQN